MTTAVYGVRCRAVLLAFGIAVCAVHGAQAESSLPALSASPLPPHAELRFCYYAGLAYSAGAMIVVEAPNRREVVADRPRKAFLCISDPAAQGRHFWQEVDPDAGDPFRN
ncbi:hypothetical protein [Antarcticimicrobium sediminis]|uniref:Uncharacterized protein n=1 Tax=Antarcticimicrobium sediminis TaxID=2546227 RepID=A0A4R5EVK4_9RHOB|nr:hypothetical protein [Antarcticimicrobium sediminis]TDE38862.1 hypothetical protein E1B25_07515 [Antarcticimicrobium sediminis]